MKQFDRRLRVLETAAGVEPYKPWRRVIVDVGESEEEVFEREGIGPDDNVIVRVILDPGGPLPDPNELGLRPRLLKNVEIEAVPRRRNPGVGGRQGRGRQ